MLKYKPGDIAWFHEEGVIMEVEVLKAETTEAKLNNVTGSTTKAGEGYTLKTTGNIKQQNSVFKPIPKDTIFSVWRAEDAGAYAGWALLDH
jgi:hypothetical protein